MSRAHLAPIVLSACFLAACARSSTVDRPTLVGRWRAGISTFGTVTGGAHATHLIITREGDTYFLCVERSVRYRTGIRNVLGDRYRTVTCRLSPVEIERKGNRLECTDARAGASLARHLGNGGTDPPYWELLVHEGRLCLDYMGRSRDPLGVGPIQTRTYRKRVD
jgi:hypothetical protein